MVVIFMHGEQENTRTETFWKLRISLVILSLVLSVLIGLSLSRQSDNRVDNPENDELLIGFSMDTLKEARWQRDRDLLTARVQALGARVLVQSANSDDTRQIQDIQALLSNDVDVLVIIPHNGKAMAKAVNMAHEANTPVISYDRLITDCDLDLCVSFDQVGIGEMQAQYLVDTLPRNRKSRIVRIYGAKTDHNSILFKLGQDNILAPYIADGQIEVIHEDWAENWKPENAKKITNAAITNHGATFDAILASNDGTAGGAIQALLEEGLDGKVVVTGQDAELVACQRIAAGTQTMSIYKPIRKLAHKVAEVAVDLARGKPIIARHAVYNDKIDVPNIKLEVTVITRENLQESVIADGFHAYEDVYRNVPEQDRPDRN
jgi:D-xylose transport system substrate-binding protein